MSVQPARPDPRAIYVLGEYPDPALSAGPPTVLSTYRSSSAGEQNSPILTTSPASLAFTAPSGGSAPPQNLQITTSSTALNYTLSASVTSPPGGTCGSRRRHRSGVTPGTISVFCESGRPGGRYCVHREHQSDFAERRERIVYRKVPVTLTVNAGSVLQLTPAAVSFAYEIGPVASRREPIRYGRQSDGNKWVTQRRPRPTAGNGFWSRHSSGTAPGNFVHLGEPDGLGPGHLHGDDHGNAERERGANHPHHALVVSNTALLVASPGIGFVHLAGGLD